MVDKVNRACLHVLRVSKILCPVDEGHLRATTDMYVTADKNEARGTIYNPLFYAPFVHQGTGIYSLEGNGRKTPWYWKGSSKKYSGWHKTVGQRPQPFIKDAMEQSIPTIDNIMRG